MKRILLGILLCALAALVSSQGWAQAPPAPAPDAEAALSPQRLAARRDALQAQLEALAKSSLPKEEVEATRALLEQQLGVLAAIAEALQRRDAFQAQLAALPQRLQELAAQRKRLEAQAPRTFAQVSEALRDELEAQLKALQAEMAELQKRNTAAEVRLAALPKELEQKTAEQAQLEKALLAARAKAAGNGPRAVLEAELVALKRQLVQVELEALEAEREWLTRRGPLHDASLAVAQLRLQLAQQELEQVRQVLAKALERQQTRLSTAAETLQRKMEQTADPAEALRLAVSLETVDIRKQTAAYRQQLHELGETILTQEKRLAQVQQDMNRLLSMVEKYASGEGVAQRLLVAFEQLRRERLRASDKPLQTLTARLRALTEQLFALDDRLYEFDRQAEARLAAVLPVVQAQPVAPREAALASLRGVLEEQRAALREQQQVLAELVQDTSRLLALHREYRRLLDESYLAVLTKMFWLRDAEAIRAPLLRAAVAGALHQVARLRAFLRTERAWLWTTLRDTVPLWGLLPLLGVALPWLAVRLRRQLRRALGAAVAAAQQRGEPPRLSGAVLALLHAAVWPAYVALLAWMRRLFLPPTYADAEFAQALLGGVQVIALVLGVASLARTVLQPGGWGQHFWGIGAELCRFLRRSLVVLCFAAVLFLVPRHVVLVAPGEAQAAAGSLALARLLFLAFQAVVVLVVGVLGWRSQPLMAAVLERSRAQQGLLWRVWPLLHGLLLAGLVGIMVLDILGYRYAARFIWFRALESLSVVLTLRLLLVMLVMRLLQRAVQLLFSAGGRLGQRYADIEATAERYFTVGRKLCNALLGLLAVGIILELWGFSVSWFVTSPLGSQILKRAGIIVLAVALVAVLMQISRALVEYLLQPRTTAAGATREPGRKVKTLVPLVQTLVNVGAVFAAALVVLEQLGVATGPILAGVGIFGLAVGFASQSLIKDVINGLFILFEDSLSVGDVVMLRGIGGQVEKVTLRTVTIRDLSGNVHVIPNSSIDLVTNMTKDFSRYLLDVRVAYREDVDAVIAVLREVDEELRRDPAYGRDILEPLEVLGLDRFDESAVVIRARIKTRPLQQWRVGREFNRRMKLAFDARGIQIPFPHRTLYWGQAKDGMPPALRVMMDEPARRLD